MRSKATQKDEEGDGQHHHSRFGSSSGPHKDDHSATYVLMEATQAMGQNIEMLNINRTSLQTRQKKQREALASKIKEEFQVRTPLEWETHDGPHHEGEKKWPNFQPWSLGWELPNFSPLPS